MHLITIEPQMPKMYIWLLMGRQIFVGISLVYFEGALLGAHIGRVVPEVHPQEQVQFSGIWSPSWKMTVGTT